MIKIVFIVTSEYTLTSNFRLSFSQANIMTQFKAVRFPFVPSGGLISADVKLTIFLANILSVFFLYKNMIILAGNSESGCTHVEYLIV